MFDIGLLQPREFILILIGAFDESGKLDDTEHVSFAGFVAKPAKWEEFREEWRRLLRPHKIKYWKTCDAVHMNGGYARFRKREKDLRTLITKLAELICKYAIEAMSGSISTSEFKQLSQDARKKLKDPQYCAFESCVRMLVSSAEVDPGDTFTLVCDDSDEYAEHCLKLYTRLQKSTVISKRIVGLCFADDKKYEPLQAADLLAFCERAERREEPPDAIWRCAQEVFSKHYKCISGSQVVK